MSRGRPTTQQRRPRTKQGAAFADFILTARRASGLTQAELATQADLDRTTVIRWEAGDISRPELNGVQSACSVLNASYTDALVALGALTAAHVAAAA